MTVDAGQLQMRPCSMVALSPFKMEWSLESRSQECKRMQDKHPNRVPIIVEPAAGVKELPRSKLLLTKTLTVAQVLRIIRSKAGMGPGVKLQLHVSGAVITKQDQRISDVYAAERDEDGHAPWSACVSLATTHVPPTTIELSLRLPRTCGLRTQSR